MDVDRVPVPKSDPDDLTKYNLENYDEDTKPSGEFLSTYSLFQLTAYISTWAIQQYKRSHVLQG